MEVKTCSKCGINERRNKTSAYCKYCHNEYQKAFYKNAPHKTRESIIKRRKEIRDIIIKHKNFPCIDCGLEYPWYVMDFDHVRGEKKFDLSVAAQKGRSIKSILDEIAKCELVCSNCHRERTFNRRPVFGAGDSGSNPFEATNVKGVRWQRQRQ
jgi:hypothetical protein